jgi:hypothetical protein
VDQISGTTPSNAPVQVQDASEPTAAAAPADDSGFGSRGRIRRRARFLRKARELAYRDLGGLVFNLHRFGQRNDALVLAKLGNLAHIDTELRTLESALGERQPVTVLREAGITACPRCAAIHSSEDRFCPHCGLSMGRHADLPIAGAAAAPVAGAAAAGQSAPAPAGQSAPASPAAPGAGAAQPLPGEQQQQPPAQAPMAAPAPAQAPAPAPAQAPTATPAPARPPTAAPVQAEPSAPAAPAAGRGEAPAPPARDGRLGRAPTPPTATPAEPVTVVEAPSSSSGQQEATEIIRPVSPGP